MNDRTKIHAGRMTVMAICAMLLVLTACGATRSTAISPIEGAGAQQGSVNGPTTTGQSGQNLMADDQYGVAGRAGDRPVAPISNSPMCTAPEPPCLEP